MKWVHEMIGEHLRSLFAKHPEVIKILSDIEEAVADGTMPAVAAVQQLIDVFEGKRYMDGKQTRV